MQKKYWKNRTRSRTQLSVMYAREHSVTCYIQTSRLPSNRIVDLIKTRTLKKRDKKMNLIRLFCLIKVERNSLFLKKSVFEACSFPLRFFRHRIATLNGETKCEPCLKTNLMTPCNFWLSQRRYQWIKNVSHLRHHGCIFFIFHLISFDVERF